MSALKGPACEAELTTPPPPALAHDELGAGLERAVESLLARRQPDGHWVGEAEGDTILESEYIILMRFLGWGPEEKLRKAAEYIRWKQLPDGGWSIYPGGPPELNASVKAYFALKLTGAASSEPRMRRARDVILRLGGAQACNSYTRFYLAALGQMRWWDAPAVPPEIVLLPPSFYFNLYEISSWSRTFVVPLSIIWAHRPVAEIPSEQGVDELFLHGGNAAKSIPLLSWRRLFLAADALLKIVEQKRLHPWRRHALRAAEDWMLAHFEKSAGLGAIFPPMVYALMALRCLGYADDHPHVIRARQALEALEIEDDDTLKVQPCTSPVWDTAIAANALAEAGMPSDSRELTEAAGWLIAKEVRNRGDWSVKRPDTEPSGWYFEYENEFYPDIDDTAMVLLALSKVSEEAGQVEAVRRAVDWILAMQGRDGGWASFDVDNNRKLFCHIPFADHNAMIDPSTADVTGRVLEMLAAHGFDESHRPVRRAVNFLLKEQERDGSWYGRWGVNYIYGTWQAIKGLTAIGLAREHDAIVRGARWLLLCQNPDGGWGETCLTYEDPSKRGTGPSTASQTAWALMGLMAAGHAEGEAARKGVDFLLRTQNADGSWNEEQWTATGFPKVFYLRYHLYGNSFPTWALGMYARLRRISGLHRAHDLAGPRQSGRTAA